MPDIFRIIEWAPQEHVGDCGVAVLINAMFLLAGSRSHPQTSYCPERRVLSIIGGINDDIDFDFFQEPLFLVLEMVPPLSRGSLSITGA